MKIVALPVDTVAVFLRGKHPAPYKFKYEDREGLRKEVRVDQILEMETRKFGGVETIIYRCQSTIEGMELRYELKYILKDARWELYKI